MPTFEVTSPDGRKFRVNAPDGATQEQAIAYAQTQAGKSAEPAVDPHTATAQGDSNTQYLLASMGGAAMGIPLALRQMLGKTQPGEVDEWKKGMAGLWSTPMGKVGTVAGGAMSAAPAMLVPGANTAVGASLVGAGLGALQPTGEGESRLANAGMGAAGGLAGKVGGDLLGKGLTSMLAKKEASQAAAKASNSVRDDLIAQAQQAGLVLPPSQVNPTLLNRTAEGFSGKLATAQAIAGKNEKMIRGLAAEELGLDPKLPITSDVLGKVREEAGKAYGAVKDAGTIPLGNDFATDFGSGLGSYLQLRAEMPSQAIPKVDGLIQDLMRPEMEAGTAVEMVKRLRHDGFKNVRSPDPETSMLGRTQLSAQDALENALERHLTNAGQADAVQNLRAARTLIAKSYAVENAVEDSTGKVVASKLGRQYANGKPLTGNLELIGKVAQAFPKAVQNVNTSMPGVSPLDFMGGVLMGGAVGPKGALAAAARPAVRSVITSAPYQAMMARPSYGTGLLGGAAPVADSEATRRMLQYLGIGAGFTPTEK